MLRVDFHQAYLQHVHGSRVRCQGRLKLSRSRKFSLMESLLGLVIYTGR